jgi:putative protein kinase ArgK-like GTPase of G3E family
VRDLEMMLSLRPEGQAHPPILRTVAATGKGVDELHGEIERRLDGEDAEGWERRRTRRARRQVEELLRERGAAALLARMGEEVDALVGQVARRELDPYSLVDRILERGLSGC